MELDRSVRHGCWDRPSSAEGPLLPSSLPPASLLLQPYPWASRDGHQNRQKMALLTRDSVPRISVDLNAKVSGKVSDPGFSACPPEFLFCPQEPLRFCPRGDGKPGATRTQSQTGTQSPWKSRTGLHFPGPLCQHHPSLAATSCPMPSRT